MLKQTTFRFEALLCLYVKASGSSVQGRMSSNPVDTIAGAIIEAVREGRTPPESQTKVKIKHEFT